MKVELVKVNIYVLRHKLSVWDLDPNGRIQYVKVAHEHNIEKFEELFLDKYMKQLSPEKRIAQHPNAVRITVTNTEWRLYLCGVEILYRRKSTIPTEIEVYDISRTKSGTGIQSI